MSLSEGDDFQSVTDTQRTSRIIRIAAALSACGFAGLAIARFVVRDTGYAPVLVLGGVLSLLAMFINSRGYTNIAGPFVIAVLTGIATFLMMVSEGIRDVAALTFPGILVLASLTLPRKLYIVMAALIVLIPGFAGALEMGKVIVTPFSDRTDLLAVIDITFVLLMTAAAIELMTGSVKESASRARLNEARFRSLFNNSSESVFVFGSLGPDGIPGKIIEANDLACRQLGYTRAEIIRLGPPDVFQAESTSKMREVFDGLAKDGSAVCECFYRSKSGQEIPVEVSLQRFDMEGSKAIIANARDITERKRADSLIRSALKEKEVLLREVHHRVKNNMQVISSLLNLQASQTQDPAAKTMLEESRQRVRSIAIIHEKLYNAANLAEIDFGTYLKSVADELLRTFGRPEISCVLDLESIPFDIDRAIPAGLIVNELLTNALRHAFPPATKGTVWVRLHSRDGNNVELVVKDDGMGFPSGADVEEATTMGLAIVRTLVEQMQATLTTDTGRGITYTIRFSLERKSDTPPLRT
jgi:PAS domain S-box-containing protein